jgi:oxygen-independent coproporphyrinogen-3 oxidase
MTETNLIQKYNIPGPRYTSYPTVPYWDNDTIDSDKWMETVERSFELSNASEGISLYVHLPYCESLCTFCGCHKRITKRHDVETPYIEALLNEWRSYRALFSETPRISELHFGGQPGQAGRRHHAGGVAGRRFRVRFRGPSEQHYAGTSG